VRLQRDGVEIMFLRMEGCRKPEVIRPTGVWDAYVRVKGLLELYQEMRGKLSLKSELTKRSYGDTKFEVADPSGYILVFGEVV
jgi:hypothetical protein